MISSIQIELVKPDFSECINKFFSEYSEFKEPIEVSFRALVPELDKSDRATHLIHTYPAKLLMHIPFFFLNNNILSQPGDTVLDSFCGSGTVLLETILSGRNAVGADANPLARLISRVKTTIYDMELLKIYKKTIFEAIPNNNSSFVPKVIDTDYWFSTRIQTQLSAITDAIDAIEDKPYRDFFRVCFSNCIKKVSFADSRVSVPVKLRSSQYNTEHPLYIETKRKLDSLESLDVVMKLNEIIDQNIMRFQNLNSLYSSSCSAKIISDEARKLFKENKKEESVSLIISSPPYAGAQKYIRASSLNLGWLKMIDEKITLKQLEDKSIGREHYKKVEYLSLKETEIIEADTLLKQIFQLNPLRAHIASNYLNEMRIAFREAINLLKPGGYLVLVAANNHVCGMEFKTQEYLTKIIEELGLKVVLKLIDDIKSYGLMTKRNKTANVITREWVLVFQK